MPTTNVPKKLASLLKLLRDNGVTSFSDGTVTLTLSPQRTVPVTETHEPTVTTFRRGTSGVSAKDATRIAIEGFDYDPSEISDITEEDNIS